MKMKPPSGSKKTNPIQTQSRNNSGTKGTLGGLENLLIGKLENWLLFS
jgi:hypothetical protein